MEQKNYMSMKNLSRQSFCPYGEHTLREMQRHGEIPGVYVGGKFMVNVEMFRSYVEKKIMESFSF